MKLRYLETALSEVDVFEEPKIELEQVPTSAHIAARMIHTAAEVYGKEISSSLSLLLFLLLLLWWW
jgi:predicted RNA methylase